MTVQHSTYTDAASCCQRLSMSCAATMGPGDRRAEGASTPSGLVAGRKQDRFRQQPQRRRAGLGDGRERREPDPAHHRPQHARPAPRLEPRRLEDRLPGRNRRLRADLRHDADGSNPTQLTFGPGDDFGVVWSPDGSQIAVVRNFGNGNRPFYLMKADGTDQHPIVGGSGFVPRRQARGVGADDQGAG
jgi:WD40-like Beta Propeller Repeat